MSTRSPRTPRPGATVAAGAALALVAALAGCAGGGDGAQAGGSPAATGRGGAVAAQDEGGPLLGLPPCDDPPPAAADAGRVAGLVLPDRAVVTKVSRDGPLTTVQAFVPETPVTVRRFYQFRPGLEIFEIEDEVFEAEALFADGKAHRSYVKARAVCRKGSTLLVIVAPEVGPALPSPTGGGS